MNQVASMLPRLSLAVRMKPGRVPFPVAPHLPSRLARLLALAHRLEREVRAGNTDLAGIARRYGLTRARVSQLQNLTLLAPALLWRSPTRLLPSQMLVVSTGLGMLTLWWLANDYGYVVGPLCAAAAAVGAAHGVALVRRVAETRTPLVLGGVALLGLAPWLF